MMMSFKIMSTRKSNELPLLIEKTEQLMYCTLCAVDRDIHSLAGTNSDIREFFVTKISVPLTEIFHVRYTFDKSFLHMYRKELSTNNVREFN